MQESFEEPITEGLWAVVKVRASNKSPGEEGIFHECYVPYWETSDTDMPPNQRRSLLEHRQ
jgi:hypothetical protein